MTENLRLEKKLNFFLIIKSDKMNYEEGKKAMELAVALQVAVINSSDTKSRVHTQCLFTRRIEEKSKCLFKKLNEGICPSCNHNHGKNKCWTLPLPSEEKRYFRQQDVNAIRNKLNEFDENDSLGLRRALTPYEPLTEMKFEDFKARGTALNKCKLVHSSRVEDAKARKQLTQKSSNHWECPFCTFRNVGLLTYCEMCLRSRTPSNNI